MFDTVDIQEIRMGRFILYLMYISTRASVKIEYNYKYN